MEKRRSALSEKDRAKASAVLEKMASLDHLAIPDSAPPITGAFSAVVPKTRSALLNAPDAQGKTALHIAAFLNNYQTVETLLFLGADPLVEDAYGQRATDLTSNKHVTALLLKAIEAK